MECKEENVSNKRDFYDDFNQIDFNSPKSDSDYTCDFLTKHINPDYALDKSFRIPNIEKNIECTEKTLDRKLDLDIDLNDSLRMLKDIEEVLASKTKRYSSNSDVSDISKETTCSGKESTGEIMTQQSEEEKGLSDILCRMEDKKKCLC